MAENQNEPQYQDEQDRVSEQVQDKEPQTMGEAVSEAIDEDPAFGLEKKIKDKITGNG